MVLAEIYRQVQKMSKQELWAYHQVIVDNIQKIRKLNPPRLNGEEKGELTDEMNQLLTDLFTVKKFVQDKLQKT